MVGPEPASILLMVFWISAIWSVHGPAHEGLSPNASRAPEAKGGASWSLLPPNPYIYFCASLRKAGLVNRREAGVAALLAAGSPIAKAWTTPRSARRPGTGSRLGTPSVSASARDVQTVRARTFLGPTHA